MGQIFAPSAKPYPTRPQSGSPPSVQLADGASGSHNENVTQAKMTTCLSPAANCVWGSLHGDR